jgi:hypothetical protein
MSNETNSVIMDNMRDNVHELWVIEGRPDLEDDCLQYCYENIDRPVPITMIEFLSQHCSQAMSTKDFDFAQEEHRKKIVARLQKLIKENQDV